MMRIDVSVPEKQGLIVRSKEGFMAEQEAGCLSFVRALHTKQVDHNATPNRSITISTLARRRASSAHTAPLRRKEHKAHTARTAHTERAAHTTPLGQTQHTNSTLAQPSTINTLHNRAQHSHTSEHCSKHSTLTHPSSLTHPSIKSKRSTLIQLTTLNTRTSGIIFWARRGCINGLLAHIWLKKWR